MDDMGDPYWGGAMIMEGDRAEVAAMQPFAAQQDAPWWQSLVMYGATRAIDNRFGRPNVQGNTDPGTFAGSNGGTYQNQPTGSGGGATRAPAVRPQLVSGVPDWALMAGGVLLVYLMTRK